MIQAAHSMEYVRSGDAVTATLIAPSAATPVEFSESIFDEHLLPEMPDSVFEQVLGEGAAVYEEILAEKDQLAYMVDQWMAHFANAQVAELAAISEITDEVIEGVARAHTAAEERQNVNEGMPARARAYQQQITRKSDQS